MSDQGPIDPQDDGPQRMSPAVKLVLMGAGAAALLYSCTPTVGAFRSTPYFWGMGNPFYRPPIAVTCPPGSPPTCDQQTTNRSGGGGGSGIGSGGSRTGSGSSGDSSGTATSSRGGFGSSAGAHGEGGS